MLCIHGGIMADEKDEKTIAEDIVVTKYKMAGEIVNSELEILVYKLKKPYVESITFFNHWYLNWGHMELAHVFHMVL